MSAICPRALHFVPPLARAPSAPAATRRQSRSRAPAPGARYRAALKRNLSDTSRRPARQRVALDHRLRAADAVRPAAKEQVVEFVARLFAAQKDLEPRGRVRREQRVLEKRPHHWLEVRPPLDVAVEARQRRAGARIKRRHRLRDGARRAQAVAARREGGRRHAHVCARVAPVGQRADFGVDERRGANVPLRRAAAARRDARHLPAH